MVHASSLQQFNRYLLCFILVGVILYFGRPILIPVAFAAFFAMLFARFCNRLEKIGLHRILSTLVALLILVSVIAGIGGLVYAQGKKLAEDFPRIEKKSQQFLEEAQKMVSTKLNVPEQKQDQVINKQVKSMLESSGAKVKDFVAGLGSFLAAGLMILVFTFLFLFQREKYETFFVKIMKGTPPDEAHKLIDRVSKVSQSYLTGRVMSICIFTTLFTIGFLIIGLKNAFLLAFMAAMLTIIPYVGSVIGGLFPFAVALVTEDSTSTAFGALGVILVVQSVDNYFIEPYIIGGEVNVSGFFSILILFVGGLLWGVPGMILFLPMLGIAKIVFEEVPALRPYAYLVGDQQKDKPSQRLWGKIKSIFKGKK